AMDYPPDYAQSTRQRAPSTPGAEGAVPQGVDFSNMHSQIGHMMWEAGSKQIKDSFNSYGRIDLFRPYFDVEPIQVRNRLMQSFLPRKPSQIAVTNDLYGPCMIVLTMVALLLWNMKSSGYTVQNGTLMGTAFVSCFAAWLFLSGILYTVCFLLSTEVSLVHIFSLFGYSMTSHCVVLILTSIYHPSHDHLYFFLLLGLFCLPSALRMAFFLSSKTREKAYKATLMAAVVGIHLLYIVYLHFGFHVVLEEIDEILGDAPPNVPIKAAVPITE
ncbi:hypothetical protein PMAYCL1PPCAC_06149, partial [Pristionchus mayeri]